MNIKKTLSIIVLAALISTPMIFSGCSGQKGVVGEWERTDASSPLYGMIIKVEETPNGYIGKIIYLTDLAKEYNFKTGQTKWATFKPVIEGRQYIIKDFTINAIDFEESWSEMMLKFNPYQPDEIKILAVDDEPNFMDSNEQTYKRVG